jgi:hypothetical protein
MKKKQSLLITFVVITTAVVSVAISCKKFGSSPRECVVPQMPPFAALFSNPKLPDPFRFMDGSRVNSKKEWDCRRAEIAALAQEFEYGYKPNTPYAATTGSFDPKNILTVTVTDSGKTMSFNCTITLPATGNKPYPAIIGVGGSNLNNTAILNLGVAIITLPNNQIAQQNSGASRGKGLFYDMFGSNHSASATMAWAWATSRLIDALEKTPAANIDPTRLGVTGCSRNGKGALITGALDERIKLTLPQEPGAGGAASWRISDAQFAAGKVVQTLDEIVVENVWFSTDFAKFSKQSDKIPFDQHSIMALCAPRALLVVENTGIDWLSPVSSWNSANAAHKVWEALGVPDKMGFSQVSHAASHCSLPATQVPDVSAYIEKFLVGTGSANTNVMKTDGGFSFDEATWVDWTVPALK